jgi:hypothetical protein
MLPHMEGKARKSKQEEKQKFAQVIKTRYRFRAVRINSLNYAPSRFPLPLGAFSFKTPISLFCITRCAILQ